MTYPGFNNTEEYVRRCTVGVQSRLDFERREFADPGGTEFAALAPEMTGHANFRFCIKEVQPC